MSQTRRTFLKGGLAAGMTFGAGCSANPNAISPLGATPATLQATVSQTALRRGALSVTISSQSNGSIASSTYVGLSWEKQVVGLGTFDASNANLIGLFRRLGASVLRIGGSTVDTDIWNPSGRGGVLGETSRRDLKRLAAFLAATNWVVKYGIRYKNNTMDNVLDEALAATSILGPYLSGLEIGNEPDGYTTEPSYEAKWEVDRSRIIAHLPTASFVAPETAGADAFFDAFALGTAGMVDVLSAHHYTGSAHDPGSTVNKLLHSTERAFLAKIERTWLSSSDPAYRVGETNSLYGGGKDGVSNTFASALWVTRYLLDGAQFGATGFNFHGGTSTEFGHELYYSPIRFAGTTGKNVIGVQPEYYGLLLTVLAGTGASYVTTVSGSPLVFAYAIGKNVVLINLDRTPFDATVTMPLPIASARSLVLRTRGGAGATHGQTLGGATVALDGSFSPLFTALPVSGQTFTSAVPEISATLIATS